VIIAVIPARGGSKELPRKNLQPLAGKPLIAHTIEAALAAFSVDRVIVSTEDEEIARVASEHGAEVVRRPDELASDDASSESALLHVLDHLLEEEQIEPDLVVFLQATSPLRRDHDIDDAVATLRDNDSDSVLSVVASHRFLWRQGETGPEPLNYDYHARPRRQEREPEYVENGSIYVLKPWVLRQHENRLGGRIALYEMDRWSAVDIDDAADLALCESILRLRAPAAGRSED